MRIGSDDGFGRLSKLLLIFQFRRNKLDNKQTETCITLSTKQTVNLIKHSLEQQNHQQTHQLVRKHFLFPSAADVLAGFRTNEEMKTDEQNMQTVNKDTDCRSAPVTYIHTI